ncbi:MAG: FecR family protein [Candidatus Acidiferrales bacterium]
MKRYLGLAVIVLFAMTMVSPALRAQDQNPPPPPAQSGQEQTAPPPGQAAPDQNGQAPDQNAPANEGEQNPQTQPAVARVSFIKGNVSIQRGDSGDWIAATLNTPIESGDRVSTGDNSRAEVQLDYANIIRLDQNSTAKITNLTRGQIQVQVGQGLVSYSVLPNSQADAEIDTPNSAVHPLRQGEYRVEIVNDSQTQVTVRDGQAEVAEPQGSTRVESGQLITIQGTDNPQYQTSNAAGPDDFDRWNDSRDHAIADAKSWQHTDRYYTGSQDLDAYGHWENVPDYGQVWVPDQDSGWAPYQAGTWEWEPYYGWTWVSYEPWGWAPYHYGRWFVYGGNWAWWPGPVGVYGGFGYYPVWAPAYVSFFGFGAGFGFGFGFGNIGWLAIGPGDFFHPWWGFGATRVGFVGFDRFGFGGGFGRGFDPLFRGRNGFSNMGRFDNDARVRAGVSSIRGDQFGHGVGNFQHGLSTQQFHQANFMTGRLPAVPNRQSLGRVEDHVSPGIARTASANNQHFFSQSRGSSTQRSFGQEASAQQRMVDSSRGQNGVGNNRSFAPANGGARDGRAGAGAGWHSFSENGSGRGQGQGNTSNRPAMQQSRGGQQGNSSRGGNNPWHQFTPPSNNGRGQQPSRNTSPRSSSGRGQSAWEGSRGSSYGNYSSRPQLNMHQPVVSQRSYGGNRGSGGYSSRGGSYSRPSGHEYRGGSGGGSSHGSSSHGGSSHGGGSHGGGHHR